MFTFPVFRSLYMKVKILLFAEARDIIEADSIEIEVKEQTSKTEIFKQIEAKFQSLAPILEVCNLAHNHVSTFYYTNKFTY